MKFGGKLHIKILALAIAIIALSCLPLKSYEQTTLQLKFSPVGIHFFNEPNRPIFENKIDSNALFILEPCAVFGVETFIVGDEFSFRAMIGGLGDAVSKPGIFIQLGLKERLFQVYRHSLSIGAGVMGYGHENWETITGYTNQKGWVQNGTWEYSIGFMVDLEYAIFINDRNDILINLTYGLQPKTFNFTIGYRFWLSTTIKNPKKCGSCPFTKTKNWKK